MIEQLWHDLLAPVDDEPLVSKGEIDDVVSLLIKWRIDPHKFGGNLYALLSGRSLTLDLLGGANTLPSTPSICKFTSPLTRPPGTPFWGLAAFPDVIGWFNERPNDQLNITIDEKELKKATGAMQYLIANYVNETSKSLEVQVQEGSSCDPYLVSDLLQMSGEDSIFTLIATLTTKFYLELKRSYSASFPDESSLLAMSGIIDAKAHILWTKKIIFTQVIDLARETKSVHDRLFEFLVRFEILMLSVDNPELSHEVVSEACQNQAKVIRGSIQRTIESYRGELLIANAVREAMTLPQFAEMRRAAGMRNTTFLGKLKGIIFGESSE